MLYKIVIQGLEIFLKPQKSTSLIMQPETKNMNLLHFISKSVILTSEQMFLHEFHNITYNKILKFIFVPKRFPMNWLNIHQVKTNDFLE